MWTDFLANVAAEDAFGFLDLCCYLLWDFVAVFDGVVGDAFTSVYDCWGDYCSCGTGV